MEIKRRRRIQRLCQPDKVPKTGILKKPDIEMLYGCAYRTALMRFGDFIPRPLNEQPAVAGCFGKTSPLFWNAEEVWSGYMRLAEARG